MEPCHVSLITIKQASEHNERLTEEFMKGVWRKIEAGNCAEVANRFGKPAKRFRVKLQFTR